MPLWYGGILEAHLSPTASSVVWPAARDGESYRAPPGPPCAARKQRRSRHASGRVIFVVNL